MYLVNEQSPTLITNSRNKGSDADRKEQQDEGEDDAVTGE